jgi:hypothetical protein
MIRVRIKGNDKDCSFEILKIFEQKLIFIIEQKISISQL